MLERVGQLAEQKQVVRIRLEIVDDDLIVTLARGIIHASEQVKFLGEAVQYNFDFDPVCLD